MSFTLQATSAAVRTGSRAAARATNRAALKKPSVSRAFISQSSGRPALSPSSAGANIFKRFRSGETDVPKTHTPVVSYQDGERTVIEVPRTDVVVTPAGKDSSRAAMPLEPTVLSKLTPTMKAFTLAGKIAVVTGGGRGLGYNMCQALTEVGVAGLAILDVQGDLGDKAAADLASQTGVDCRFYQVDVRDETAVQNTMDDVYNHFGKIDILVSSAGIADSNIPAEKYDTQMWRRLIDINITGTFLVAQAVARKMMLNKNPGSMVFIASMSGSIVNYPQEQSCYNTSKAGVMQLTKSLGAEWARYGIRVNAISPGYMDTALNRVPALDAQKKIWIDHTPQKRLGDVDELNGLCVYLASDASSYMTGSNVIIDGGYTLW